jgi:hypothetical protein
MTIVKQEVPRYRAHDQEIGIGSSVSDIGEYC